MTCAAAMVVAALVGAALGCSSVRPAAVAPSSTTIADVSTADVSTSVADAGSGAVHVDPDTRVPDDATLISVMLSLSDLGSADEVARLVATNVPEDEVARCMLTSGFRYVSEGTPEQQVAESPLYSLSTEAFAERYGFGLASARLGLLNVDDSQDPNSGYVASLSAEQHTAYSRALAGCRHMDSAGARYSDALNDAVARFRSIIGADQRVIDATGTWRRCMSSAGYRFDAPWTMRDQFATTAAEASSAQLQRALVAEIAAARANVPCEAPLIAIERDVAIERFAEFKQLLLAGLAG